MERLLAGEWNTTIVLKTITSPIVTKTVKHSMNCEQRLHETISPFEKEIQRLKYEKKSRQCKVLNDVVQRIYMKKNMNNLEHSLAKKCSEQQSEIERLRSLLLQVQKKVKNLRRLHNKIVLRHNVCIKIVTLLQRQFGHLEEFKELRRKLFPRRWNSRKLKKHEQNNSLLRTLLLTSGRPTSVIHPASVQKSLDSKLTNSEIQKSSEDSEESYKEMTKHLITILPSRFLPLTMQQIDISDNDKLRLTVRSANESRVLFIIPDLCVLTTENNEEFYFFETQISSIDPSLGSVCAVMERGFVVKFYKEYFVFKAKSDITAVMILRNPFDATNTFISLPDDTISKEEHHLHTIKKVLRAEVIKLLRMKYGIKFGAEDDDNISIRSERDNNSTRSEAELAQALFDAFPNISNYYRYCNDTFYHCHTKTNIWNSLKKDDFHGHIQQNLKRKIHLTQAEVINISINDTILKIQDIIAPKIEDLNFIEQLDSVTHIFATDNKAVDMSTIPPVIRDIKCDDLINRTSGWTYDIELSRKHKKSVVSFFNELLPKPSEQKWFLSFIARMLNRKRNKEICIILSDTRGGKSGKHTLTQLLHAVFGNYFLHDFTSVIAKRTQNNNRIDLSIDSLKNKRLLVADGSIKNETLSVDFIKSITNSNRNSRSKVLVQAVSILDSPKHSPPKLKMNDKDFSKSMVTCPMRSRFVSEKKMASMKVNGEDITNTYVAEKSAILRQKFFEWRSAILDVLLEFYEESLPPAPVSMIDRSYTIGCNNDPYANWLDTYVEVVEESGRFISALEIMEQMKKSFRSCDIEKLESAMTTWAEKNNYIYRPMWFYKDEQAKIQKAVSVIVDAKFCSSVKNN
uniref:AsIV-cont00001-ORF1 n=1 Tax=Apophua simplicipes ichnovirus TaxID=1329648 RepID=S5DMF1_9VIRU|nr:AsIV-cont00001-ORF1 [Apophua simplicipes ichnovirus]